jgi:hypothetical protein
MLVLVKCLQQKKNPEVPLLATGCLKMFITTVSSKMVPDDKCKE